MIYARIRRPAYAQVRNCPYMHVLPFPEVLSCTKYWKRTTGAIHPQNIRNTYAIQTHVHPLLFAHILISYLIDIMSRMCLGKCDSVADAHLYTMCPFANCSHYRRKLDAIHSHYSWPIRNICYVDAIRTLGNPAYMRFVSPPSPSFILFLSTQYCGILIIFGLLCTNDNESSNNKKNVSSIHT